MIQCIRLVTQMFMYTWQMFVDCLLVLRFCTCSAWTSFILEWFSCECKWRCHQSFVFISSKRQIGPVQVVWLSSPTLVIRYIKIGFSPVSSNPVGRCLKHWFVPCAVEGRFSFTELKLEMLMVSIIICFNCIGQWNQNLSKIRGSLAILNGAQGRQRKHPRSSFLKSPHTAYPLNRQWKALIWVFLSFFSN